MSEHRLTDLFFRHEYGNLVAVLSRRFGFRHIEAIEDAVQSALLKAIENWIVSGQPENPSAWLFQVAQNDLRSKLRQKTNHSRILMRYASETTGILDNNPEHLMPGEIRDDLLRMLFVCCDDTIPADSQLVFALKTLCGFSTREISIRLFTSQAGIYKRLARARNKLRECPRVQADLTSDHYASRLPAVNKIIYVLFTEGYLSSHTEIAIRRDLCEEAIRLALVLTEHPVGRVPEAYALLALMHLHMARMTTRQGVSGGLLLLEEQNRALWDRDKIRIGLEWLSKSAQGDVFSRYHAEAGIAAEHCLAPSFNETNWQHIAESYALLEQTTPSPIHKLNRAVAIAEWRGPAAGLDVLKSFEPPTWLAGSYMWAAILADLHRRCGNSHSANGYREAAFNLAPTIAVRNLLQRRLQI